MKVLASSLTGIIYDGEATACTLPTKNGEITILPHHRPLMSILKSGITKITNQAGETIEIPIQSGFLEVSLGGTVHILLD